MNDSCNKHIFNASRYLDKELGAQESEEFLAHLRTCPSCAARLNEERVLSDLLHQSRPLYALPASLRERVSKTLAQHQPRRGLKGLLQWPFAGNLHTLLTWKMLAPVALLAAVCVLFVVNVQRRMNAADYVAAAAAVHHDNFSGTISPGIRPVSPEKAEAWVAGKVPFHFKLPPSAANSQAVYRLAGARLVSYRGSNAASITYEAGEEKVSLVVASSKSAVAGGGDAVRSGKITFHYHTRDGLRVTTWSNKGVSYALVSPLSVSARRSCLVCHQDMADRKAFEAVHESPSVRLRQQPELRHLPEQASL